MDAAFKKKPTAWMLEVFLPCCPQLRLWAVPPPLSRIDEGFATGERTHGILLGLGNRRGMVFCFGIFINQG